MRVKLVTILSALILLLTGLPNVIGSHPMESTEINSHGKPDLIGEVKVVKINGYYVFRAIITNIGDARAEFWSINATLYDFGGYLFHKIGLDTRHNLFHYLFAYLLAWLGHINIFKVLNWYAARPNISNNIFPPLDPGDSFYWDSLPLPNQDYFINAQIGFVIECIVDENNLVDESNEDNNYRIYRWWFPYKTEPPF